MKVYIVVGGYYYGNGYDFAQYSIRCFSSKDAAEGYKSSISKTGVTPSGKKFDFVNIIERDIHDDWVEPVDFMV